MLFQPVSALGSYTVKKRCFTEPLKKVPEVSKSLQRGPKSQKTDKKIYETFKGSFRVSRGRTFSCTEPKKKIS